MKTIILFEKLNHKLYTSNGDTLETAQYFSKRLKDTVIDSMPVHLQNMEKWLHTTTRKLIFKDIDIQDVNKNTLPVLMNNLKNSSTICEGIIEKSLSKCLNV